MQIETKEVTVLKGQTSKLENQAMQVIITSPEENANATDLKAKLKDMAKTVKERKEAITKPLNEALRSARDLFAPIETQLDNANFIIGNKLLAYKKQVEAEARAEQDRIAAKLEADRKKLEAEVEAGKISQIKADQKLDLKLQKAEEKIDQVQTVQKTIHTSHGTVQFRKIRKVRIIKAEEVPDEYWVLDQIAIRSDALAGKSIPGVEVYEEETV